MATGSPIRGRPHPPARASCRTRRGHARMAEALLDLEIARLRWDRTRPGPVRRRRVSRSCGASGSCGTRKGAQTLALVAALGDRFDAVELHRLRRQVRRLRYAAELSGAVEGQVAAAAADFRALQDELGALARHLRPVRMVPTPGRVVAGCAATTPWARRPPPGTSGSSKPAAPITSGVPRPPARRRRRARPGRHGPVAAGGVRRLLFMNPRHGRSPARASSHRPSRHRRAPRNARGPEDERPLTPKGEKRFRVAAKGLARICRRPDVLLLQPARPRPRRPRTSRPRPGARSR